MYKNDTKQYWDRTSQHQNQVLYSPTHKQESWVSSRQYLFLHLCQGLPMYSSLSTKNATKGYGYYIYYSYCCYYLNSLIHSYCCSLQLEHLNKHYYCCSPGLLEFNERQPAKEPVNQTSTTVLFLPLTIYPLATTTNTDETETLTINIRAGLLLKCCYYWAATSLGLNS